MVSAIYGKWFSRWQSDKVLKILPQSSGQLYEKAIIDKIKGFGYCEYLISVDYL